MLVPKDSFIIVGGGAFGAATALELIQQFPHADICLFDRQPFPCNLAASWDYNKVIRSDYGDLFSMRLALEALEAWRTHPLFSPFYHEDGMFWINDTDLARTIAENYKKLGAKCKHSVLPVEEAKEAYSGMFDDADYTNVSEVLVNENCGWAEAKEVLENLIQTAVDAGVKYIVADVASLHIIGNGTCAGVKTTTGDIYGAAHTILCTGAGTAKLLADTAPDWEELQVGERLVAAAICTGLTKLDKNDSTFQHSPVCCQDVMPGRGGALPPTRARELKFWVDIPFRNTVEVKAGRHISVPDYNQACSPRMKKEVGNVKRGVYGVLGDHVVLDNYRICWDAITPDENFILSGHPHCKHLYVATGGSFHGFKFLPILGKYIVQMIQGTLDQQLAKSWAWDRDHSDIPAGDMWPQREMVDLLKRL